MKRPEPLIQTINNDVKCESGGSVGDQEGSSSVSSLHSMSEKTIDPIKVENSVVSCCDGADFSTTDAAEEDESNQDGSTCINMRKKRPMKKAPNAPKRFKSAYICFVMDRMEEMKKKLVPELKVTDIMKRLAFMWRTLPPLERKKYERIAEEDKNRYFEELSVYTGPMQVPNKRQKKPKDAPKRAMSAFLSYSQQMRPLIRSLHPNLKNTDISGVLAERWKTASEEERRPHLEKELIDRELYHEEMARWKESEQARQQQEVDEKRQRTRNTIDFLELPSDMSDIGEKSTVEKVINSRVCARPVQRSNVKVHGEEKKRGVSELSHVSMDNSYGISRPKKQKKLNDDMLSKSCSSVRRKAVASNANEATTQLQSGLDSDGDAGAAFRSECGENFWDSAEMMNGINPVPRNRSMEDLAVNMGVESAPNAQLSRDSSEEQVDETMMNDIADCFASESSESSDGAKVQAVKKRMEANETRGFTMRPSVTQKGSHGQHCSNPNQNFPAPTIMPYYSAQQQYFVPYASGMTGNKYMVPVIPQGQSPFFPPHSSFGLMWPPHGTFDSRANQYGMRSLHHLQFERQRAMQNNAPQASHTSALDANDSVSRRYAEGVCNNKTDLATSFCADSSDNICPYRSSDSGSAVDDNSNQNMDATTVESQSLASGNSSFASKRSEQYHGYGLPNSYPMIDRIAPPTSQKINTLKGPVAKTFMAVNDAGMFDPV